MKNYLVYEASALASDHNKQYNLTNYDHARDIYR